MRSVGVFANPYKKNLPQEMPGIFQLLRQAGLKVYCPEGFLNIPKPDYPECKFLPAAEIPALCDMIICFGGDGTVLRTVQIVRHHETPILAVNVGGLGFLTEVLFEDFPKALKTIQDGNFVIENRLVLKGEIEDDPKPLFVLNEFTIEKGRSTRVIEVDVHIDNKFFNNYVADGLIVSTPTGSTGYSLSSGGPIVVPTNHSIILNPICPHSLTNRPVIISSESAIKAQIFTDYPKVLISADNQDIREITSRTVMHISRAPFYTKLVKYSDTDYFSLLRNKLDWGGDFRDKLRWHYQR
ncbi:MAG: NAD(+)/NADH kinase [bacterium]|nr:MAG: NAD(+)/NADH kinase [bacterium]